jgi:phosphatidate cytidylyltransferase
MIISLILSVAILFGLGALIIYSTHTIHAYAFNNRRGDWLKYLVYIIIINSFLGIALAGKYYLGMLLFLIAMAGGFELHKNWHPVSGFSALVRFCLTAMIFLALGHLLITYGGAWPYEFIFIFLLTSVTDSYSQLWGKLIGRRRLCPNLSPNKTWEGFIGGLISCIAAAAALGFLVSPLGIVGIIIYGAAIAVSANIGDLLFSFIKRRLEIKDFSGILPGHGGILDRFDSLIIAAPVSFWVRYLFLR